MNVPAAVAVAPAPAGDGAFKIFVEHAADGLVVIDPEGIIRFANPAAIALFDVNAGELVGLHLGVPAIEKPTELILPNAQRTRYVELVATDIFWQGREAHLASLRDITDRKEAADKLHKSEELFRQLTEGVKDYAIISLDPLGRVVTWNEGARQLKGYEKAEILGHSMDCFYLPEDVAAGTPSRLLELAASAGHCEDEGLRVRKDGTSFVANVVLTATRDAAGALVGFAKITRDITERRRHEQRIQDQLQRLQLLDQITRSVGEHLDLQSIFQVIVGTLEESLPVDIAWICLHDEATNALIVTCVSARSQELAGDLAMHEQTQISIDGNGLAGCMQGQLVYEPDLGQMLFPFPERLAAGGLHSLVLAPLRAERRVLGVLAVARRAVNAFSSADCEFLRQLSEHVALAAQQSKLYALLKQAYDDLRRTQEAAMRHERLRALGQMASGIAHDINNALSPVSLYTESMLETETNLSDRARSYLQTIQLAVEDVAHTVGRMREFYRGREPQIELLPVDINLMVQQVLKLTKSRWHDEPLRSGGVTIHMHTDLAPDLPRIMGLESELRDALTNLIFNAVDAMPEGGTLTLRTRLGNAAGDGSVILEVIDTGVGMDDDTRRKCVEPFFTTKGERGTGLGLAMVFGMVQRHGADIEFDSAPGNGTTVRLAFGAPAADLAQVTRLAKMLVVPSGLRLLLVDDDPVLMNALRNALATDLHIIVSTTGGAAGIAEFAAALGRGEPYEAVITDLGMPHMGGREVAAAIKAASPDTPVILLTGWGQRMAAGGDIPKHVDRVLAKPPRLRELRQALAELC
jgi:PAS domain S-box-containing protein